MKELKGLGIKLFGKKIVFPENGNLPVISSGGDTARESDTVNFSHEYSNSDLVPFLEMKKRTCLDDKKVKRAEVEAEQQEGEDNEKDLQTKEQGENENKLEDKDLPPTAEELSDAKTLPESDDNPKTPSIDEDTATLLKPPSNENDESSDNTTNSEQKTLKKPDKIIPCPRCNSMDTKFCYYNNYNVNQPRHFCKSCQRYWTAGGTMRNVPVGAGRRKTKSSTAPLHCRHITIPEGLQVPKVEMQNGMIRHPNGAVLSFDGSALDSPLSQSIACVLNLGDKNGSTKNGLNCELERGNGDDSSTGTAVTTPNLTVEWEKNGGHQDATVQKIIHGFAPPVPCLASVPWPYPWNPAVPVPTLCPPGFPIPVFSAQPYWTSNAPGWSIPWVPPPSNSTNLGKHSREGDLLRPRNAKEHEPLRHKVADTSILVPKTLRINDPDEAAKSSIWAILGTKNDSVRMEGLFKAFQAKGDAKKHKDSNSPVMQYNPAALSRSLDFQERV